MFDELNKYKNNGHFFYDGKALMKEVCNAPEEGIGVYIIYRLAHGNIDLVFIGSYGKVIQNPTLEVTEKGLIKEITKGSKLNDWKIKILSEDIDALDIYWFETFDKEPYDIPSTIKGVIMQKYFDVHRNIPPWNNEF